MSQITACVLTLIELQWGHHSNQGHLICSGIEVILIIISIVQGSTVCYFLKVSLSQEVL